MTDESAGVPTPLVLSDREKRVLELYDKLQQLQLEIALLNAQKSYVPGRRRLQSIPFLASSPPLILPTDATSERTVEVAQNELLDARARYMLRNEVVASVVSANPILQAVHNGTKASPIER